jgi:putative hydrolase of HD superfamily
MDKRLSDATSNLGRLIMQFGQVNRVTLLPDGITPESDTDHTVMLGIIACAFAHEYEPTLDVGKIAQFALVHDLVEAYAGDTDTFGMHKDTNRKKQKEARETAALERIEKEFGEVFPWITLTIREYETLESAEARFIKTMDKVLPKVTHALNNAAYLKDLSSFKEHYLHQGDAMRATYAADQEKAMALYDNFTDIVEEILKARAQEA